MRCRSLREKPKAAPAPSRGRGPGTEAPRARGREARVAKLVPVVATCLEPLEDVYRMSASICVPTARPAGMLKDKRELAKARLLGLEIVVLRLTKSVSKLPSPVMLTGVNDRLVVIPSPVNEIPVRVNGETKLVISKRIFAFVRVFFAPLGGVNVPVNPPMSVGVDIVVGSNVAHVLSPPIQAALASDAFQAAAPSAKLAQETLRASEPKVRDM